jgi:selenocysteine lyase/cysteine desulfurase
LFFLKANVRIYQHLCLYLNAATMKHLFALDPHVHYFNTAAYGPALQTAYEAGVAGLQKKAIRPFEISAADHFSEAETLRGLFSQLIHAADPERIALIPSVSYGLAVVARNLHRLPGIDRKKHIVLVGEEFPNDVYAFERVCAELGLDVRSVPRPEGFEGRGARWNAALLDAVDQDTALVVAPHIHWMYGVRFDLEALGRRCRQAGALLVVDGAQSVGALHIDVQKIGADALIVPAYKWLLGPYGLGLAYFGAFFDEGIPVEENWANRVESDDFARLTRYLRDYRPKAQRYNMGEFAQFAQVPVALASLRQILDWGVDSIQQYSQALMRDALAELTQRGFRVEDAAWRAQHLFGILLPPGMDPAATHARLREHRVYASLRGEAIRLSVHLFNTNEDVLALMAALRE